MRVLRFTDPDAMPSVEEVKRLRAINLLFGSDVSTEVIEKLARGEVVIISGEDSCRVNFAEAARQALFFAGKEENQHPFVTFCASEICSTAPGYEGWSPSTTGGSEQEGSSDHVDQILECMDCGSEYGEGQGPSLWGVDGGKC